VWCGNLNFRGYAQPVLTEDTAAGSGMFFESSSRQQALIGQQQALTEQTFIEEAGNHP
jgi:hypothetical protein